MDTHPILFTILALPVVCTVCVIILAILDVEVYSKRID